MLRDSVCNDLAAGMQMCFCEEERKLGTHHQSQPLKRLPQKCCPHPYSLGLPSGSAFPRSCWDGTLKNKETTPQTEVGANEEPDTVTNLHVSP